MCIQMLGMFLNGLSGQEITFNQPFLQAATPQFPVPVEEVTGNHCVTPSINEVLFWKQKAFGSEWCPPALANLAQPHAGFYLQLSWTSSWWNVPSLPSQ